MVVVTHRHHAAPGFYRDTVLAKAKARNTARGFRPVGVSPGYISTGYGLHAPQRHFGTRLGPGYTNTISARDTYGDYSSSYLPPVGRDSYSAYRASDAAIDLEDDLVSRSRRRDAELLYGVNGELARCGNSSNWPALLSYRSSSVPNMSMIGLSGPPVSASRRQVTRRTYGAKNSAPGIGRYRQMVSVCPPPRVPTTYTTVKSGADLLLPYERTLGRESVDLASAASRSALRLRIADALANVDRQGALLGRYLPVDGDVDVEHEVRRIKQEQATRAQSCI